MNLKEDPLTSSKENTSIHFSLKNKFLRYAIVGAMSTALHILVASAYLHSVSNSILISNISGFLVAYLFSYFMQSKLVFQKSISAKKAIKYFFVQFGTLMLAIFASKHMIFENFYLQTVTVAIILVLASFAMHMFWTFSKKE